jgi:hypothetical protein
MSRIRSLHPGQWTDEQFVACSPTARLLALGLRNEADDNGIFEWKPITIKMRLFPNDAVEVCELLQELENSDQIKRFESGGKTYGAIRNFRKYQRPEKPKSWHPITDELRVYVGLSEPDQQPLPDQSPTDQGKSPQRKEEGGDRKEKKDSAPAALDADFETWWGVYPKKADKGHARKEYLKARKRGIPPETLLGGAERYRDDPKRSPDFTKNAGTWLTGECWGDEPAAGAGGEPVRLVTQEEREANRHAMYAEMIKRRQSPGLGFSAQDRFKMIKAGMITMEDCEKAGCAA